MHSPSVRPPFAVLSFGVFLHQSWLKENNMHTTTLIIIRRSLIIGVLLLLFALEFCSLKSILINDGN